MKKMIVWFLKAAVAGGLALLIASAFCLFYYNPGVHVTNKTGVTDYVWHSNTFAGTMREGIAWNRTDENGFYNENAVDKNMDILVMGSSQMEGHNVSTERNTASVLGALTDKTTYNIGTSGHSFLYCVKNLETALSVMEPTEYVIIETGSVKFKEAEINECLSGEMESLLSHDSGLLFHLQKIPYLKLVYAQLQSWDGVKNEKVAPAEPTEQKIEEESVTVVDPLILEAYDRLAKEISDTCREKNVRPIVFYHPHLTPNADGTVSVDHDEAFLEAFASACRANGVLFADMTEDFFDMYDEEQRLPHGFCNTAVGTGHLNRYGHEVIAERLADIISADSGAKEGNSQ